MTSEIRDVEILSIIARPTPYTAEQINTNHLVDGLFVKNCKIMNKILTRRGTEEIEMIMIDRNSGINLFLSIFSIGL